MDTIHGYACKHIGIAYILVHILYNCNNIPYVVCMTYSTVCILTAFIGVPRPYIVGHMSYIDVHRPYIVGHMSYVSVQHTIHCWSHVVYIMLSYIIYWHTHDIHYHTFMYTAQTLMYACNTLVYAPVYIWHTLVNTLVYRFHIF